MTCVLSLLPLSSLRSFCLTTSLLSLTVRARASIIDVRPHCYPLHYYAQMGDIIWVTGLIFVLRQRLLKMSPSWTVSSPVAKFLLFFIVSSTAASKSPSASLIA